MTATRIASHVPAAAGPGVRVAGGARTGEDATRPRNSDADADYPARPTESPAGRRRGHLWPINRSASHPTATLRQTGRRLDRARTTKVVGHDRVKRRRGRYRTRLGSRTRERASARGVHQSHPARRVAVCHLPVGRGQRRRPDSRDLPAGNRRDRAVFRTIQSPGPGCWPSRAASSPITSATPNRGRAPPPAPIPNTCSTATATPADSKTWSR